MRGDAGATRVAGSRIHAAADDARRETVLVSDLHVPQAGGEVLVRFRELLTEVAQRGPRARLVVLGDLLEALVNERQLRSGCWPDLLGALRAVVDAGVSVSVLHGNRDYMLGQRFASATGCRVVNGGLALTLDDRPTLLLHGDELCSNDEPYQRSKRWLRSRVVRAICRNLTERSADRIAAIARRKSMVSTSQGDPDRFRPVTAAVREAFDNGYAQLVFGHVHTPGHGRMGSGTYWVLPAFDADPVYLEHARGGELRFRGLGETEDRTYAPLEFAPAR